MLLACGGIVVVHKCNGKTPRGHSTILMSDRGAETDEEAFAEERANHGHEYEEEYDYYSASEEEEEVLTMSDRGGDNDEEEVPAVERLETLRLPGHCFDPRLGVRPVEGESVLRPIDSNALIRSRSAAPNLSCMTLDGRRTSLAHYVQNGKPTLLCFYVPWSGPCRLACAEMVRRIPLEVEPCASSS